MDHQALILTPSMTVHRIVPWQEAASLYVHGRFGDRQPVKIHVLETWDEMIHAPSIEFPLPAVAVLTRTIPHHKKGVRFSKTNVVIRDQGKCQYCGRSYPLKLMNRDHVIPRVQGGLTNWRNIALSCRMCNDKKGGRTPEQAGMKLRRPPYEPKVLPMTGPVYPIDRIPKLWAPYLDPSSMWSIAQAG